MWCGTKPTQRLTLKALDNNSHETLIWATKSEQSKFTFNYKTAKALNRESMTEAQWAKGLRKQLAPCGAFRFAKAKSALRQQKGTSFTPPKARSPSASGHQYFL